MQAIALPKHYDYVAIYLTDRCPLRCSYCITEHNDTQFIRGRDGAKRLPPAEWITSLNRLQLPEGVPITLQGGEPLVYPGVWELLEGLEHDFDILTALPKNAPLEQWEKLSPKTLQKLNRKKPYPNIRVSYHPGQNKIEELIPRVRELQNLVSIGIYIVDHPGTPEETRRARELCQEAGVFFKTKEYLGFHQNKLYGEYRYPDAVQGKITRPNVLCKNTVLIVGPDANVYRCHSDLYHKRTHLSVGQLTDPYFSVEDKYRSCKVYGLCSECDIKVKNNHEQKFGYTSVSIAFAPAPAELHAASLSV